jgi:hypothetical protein
VQREVWFIFFNSETKIGLAALTQVPKVTANIIRTIAIVILSHRIGLVKAEWAPDGRTVVCFSDWGVSILYILETVEYLKYILKCFRL